MLCTVYREAGRVHCAKHQGRALQPALPLPRLRGGPTQAASNRASNREAGRVRCAGRAGKAALPPVSTPARSHGRRSIHGRRPRFHRQQAADYGYR